MVGQEVEPRRLTNDKLIKKYIRQDPNVNGVEHARITVNDIHVWALVNYLDGVEGRDKKDPTILLAREYGVPKVAVRAVLRYYHDHKDVIDQYRSEINIDASE